MDLNNLILSKNRFPFLESSSKLSSSKTCDFIDNAEYQANIIYGRVFIPKNYLISVCLSIRLNIYVLF